MVLSGSGPTWLLQGLADSDFGVLAGFRWFSFLWFSLPLAGSDVVVIVAVAAGVPLFVVPVAVVCQVFRLNVVLVLLFL